MRVNTNSLAGTPLRSLAPLESPAIPATVSGPPAFASGHSIPDNGYQEKPGYPRPVQDTQPPTSPVENSEQTPQANFGAIPRMSGGSVMPSPNPQALSPQPSREHPEQETELSGTYTANVDSVPTSARGPVSPTVSFQPLPRTAMRTSHLPGATVSVPSPDTTGSVFAKGAGDQATAATCLSTNEGVPTSSVTTSAVPSSTKSVPVNTMPSKVSSKSPISAKPSTAATNMAPSKLPINSVYAGLVPSRVPTSVAKPPGSMTPPERSSSQAKETLEAPAATVPTGSNLPRPHNSSRSLPSEPEMSKPGVLVSQVDNEPFSVCSLDLAISPSSSLASEPNHGPEENEYSSFRIQVDEVPSADLLAGSSGPQATQQPPEQEVLCDSSLPWGKWLGATGALLAAVLAVMLYRSKHLAH
ncbi:mitochondrial antiviral-signaling protein isoform X2 [Acomys russatus]|uniref:mitochondrial antiviral-signaling protein isoform X2 n=1 Tax=Acomys russatus TaxID=60746 RepID=UPI0021E2AE18|nr:mitochondrial antiviral-signaling protein isoform X2 [Acomys russatus]